MGQNILHFNKEGEWPLSQQAHQREVSQGYRNDCMEYFSGQNCLNRILFNTFLAYGMLTKINKNIFFDLLDLTVYQFVQVVMVVVNLCDCLLLSSRDFRQLLLDPARSTVIGVVSLTRATSGLVGLAHITVWRSLHGRPAGMPIAWLLPMFTLWVDTGSDWCTFCRCWCPVLWPYPSREIGLPLWSCCTVVFARHLNV